MTPSGTLDRWLWLCPIVGLIAAVVFLWLFGLGWLAALGIAFLFACPAIVVWTLRDAYAAFGLRDRMLNDLTKPRSSHG